VETCLGGQLLNPWSHDGSMVEESCHKQEAVYVG
jgi:hypothetical protein